MNPSSFRTARALLALLILVGVVAAWPAPTEAQPPLTSNPQAIQATLALGTRREVGLTLTNTGATALSLRLFEALAPSPAAGRRTAPARARVPLPRQHERVDPRISEDLTAAPDGKAEFLVFLADQADLAAAYTITDWAARGEFVYKTLYDHATDSQAELRSFLDARSLGYTPLWVVNALLVHGDTADVRAISRRAEVAMLRANRSMTLFHERSASADLDEVNGCSPNARNACWNIARVGADRVWAHFGVRGQGIVVANIDSGVSYSHPALVGQYRGNLGGGAFEHNYNWYDPYEGAEAPVDAGNHGTHTMGTMVARGTAAPAAPAVGVAPGASWIAARGCAARSCNEGDLIAAAQWMLAPTDLSGANPRPDLRPHIVNNSWSGGGGDDWYAGYTAAWRAAGIFAIFSAGNTGNLSGCSTIQSPGDYSDVVGVGAVDRDDRLPWFSSIGPTVDGRLKPDLTAPGDNVPSTIAEPGEPYDTLSGTSMAAPHVAGAAALLWSANPALIGDLDATYAILTESALPRVDDTRFSGDGYANCQPFIRPNNLYGYGRLDTYAAVAQARVDLPWLQIGTLNLGSISPGESATIPITLDARTVPGPGVYEAQLLAHGSDLTQPPVVVPVKLTVPADPSHATVSGTVRRASDGAPLVGQVRVSGGATVSSGLDGRFRLILPPDGTLYTIVASAFDYAPVTRTLSLSFGERQELEFALERARPQITLDTTPRAAELAFGAQTELQLPVENTGTQPLNYTLSVPDEPYGVWRSDQSEGPPVDWINPPPDAVTLPLTDDGSSQSLDLGFELSYFDRSYSQVWIAANGFISLAALPAGDKPFTEVCLPLTETPEAAIAPLRIDLDPSQGGRVSYARIAEGFLVTWEDVPMYGDSSRKMSFQALLRPDGRISFNYRGVAALEAGDFGSSGLQAGANRVQQLGCQGDLSLADGLTVELRPQLSSAQWIELPAPQGQIMPGQTSVLPVRLRWAPPVSDRASSGTLLLISNDPDRPTIRLTVRLRTTEAPYRGYFPYVGHEVNE